MTNPTTFAQQDLTRRKVFTLAVPIMLANSASPLVGIVDTAVIGQLGDTVALAAIALGAVIYGIVYWGFGFLRMSTAGLSAQADGADDQGAVQAHLARAVPIGLIIGGFILAAQLILLPLVLKAYPSESDVEAMARTYLSARLWGLPATLGGLALMGWFIGLGRPKAALIMQLVLNILNAALSVIFVLRLGWGVSGVAYASAIADWAGFLAGLILARAEIIKRGGLNRSALTRKALMDRAEISKLGVQNSNIFIRTIAMVCGFQFFNWHAANQGGVFLAGNFILMQFFNLVALMLDSFAHVAEAATGSAYGARNKAKFHRAVRLTSEFSVVFALLTGVVLITLGPLAIDLMTPQIDVRISAKAYLPYCALVPIAGFAAWQLDGIFIGTTHTRSMRNASVAALFIYIATHFALYPVLGAAGIWVAFLIYYVARAATLVLGYPAILRRFDS